MEPKKIDELDAKRLEVLHLRADLAARDAQTAIAKANEAHAAYEAEFARLCNSIGADRATAQIDFETGMVT